MSCASPRERTTSRQRDAGGERANSGAPASASGPLIARLSGGWLMWSRDLRDGLGDGRRTLTPQAAATRPGPPPASSESEFT